MFGLFGLFGLFDCLIEKERSMKEYPDDIPWREILKEALVFLVVLVVFFTVMAAISAPSIAWMMTE